MRTGGKRGAWFLAVAIATLIGANAVYLGTTIEPDQGRAATTTAEPTLPATAVAVPTAPDPGIALTPRDSLADAIAASPAGARFELAPGRYAVRAPLEPKDGQQFVGQPGTILTGLDRTMYCFTGSARAVVIRRLVITDFAPPRQEAAVSSKDGAGWVIERNEIRESAAAGIYAGSGSQVIDNVVHHNHQIGIKAAGKDILFEGNEVAYNNYREEFSWGWEAGGSKFVHTDGLVLRDNFVHHNAGPGLWTDIDNIRTTIEGNRVEDNHDNGIFHEISYDAVIRNNVVRRNGFKRAYEWLNGAGIFISASGGSGDGEIEVYGNIVADNLNGIALQQQDRGDGDYGPHLVRNVRVHDNEIRMKVGASGAVEDVGGDAMFGADIVFARNDYRVGDARAWRWDGRDLDWKAWQAYGLDEGGSARRI